MAQSLPTPPNSPVSGCSDTRRKFKQEVRSEPNVPQHKIFFPESGIRRFFATGTVKELLECRCPKCCNHRRLHQIANPASYVSHVLGRHSKDRHLDSGYVILLALLVYIECPALIYTFIHGRCGDGQFKSQTARFTHEYVRDTFWHRLPPGDVEEYAQEFDWERYRFAIPRMEGDHYEEYPSSTILPFVNEKRVSGMAVNGEIISEGHYGDVYSFDILEGYCDFPVSPGDFTCQSTLS